MDMRLRSYAVRFRPMRCRPESLWDCVFKGYPITDIGRSGVVPDFSHCSYEKNESSENVCRGAQLLEGVTSRGVVWYFDSCNQNVQEDDNNCCPFTANTFRHERDSAKSKQTKLIFVVCVLPATKVCTSTRLERILRLYAVLMCPVLLAPSFVCTTEGIDYIHAQVLFLRRTPPDTSLSVVVYYVEVTRLLLLLLFTKDVKNPIPVITGYKVRG